jgi:hypothetical protein
LKAKTILILLGLLAFWGAESKAIIFGIRFSDVQQQALPGMGDTSPKGRFGAYVGTRQKNSILLLGADYDRYKLSRPDSLLYSRRLTVNVGYRYQLLEPDKAKAMSFMPFLALHYFKSFSKVSADSTVMSAADRRYFQDLSNDSGIWGAVGAEYFFAPVFSLGCEAGLRYSTAKSKAYGYETKLSQFTSYVALLASFYW